MAEWDIHIGVVVEPYTVPSNGCWAGDTAGLVALTTRPASGAPLLTNIVKGQGWVAANVRNVLVIGGYFSPNSSNADFEEYLRSLRTMIAHRRPSHIMFAGDLNAKSVAWGSSDNNARGIILENWLVLEGLVILNRGTVDTCIRRQGGSVVDVTFATPDLASRVSGWKVEEAETLSDHRYIRYEVSALLPDIQIGRSGPGEPPRWAIKKLNIESAEIAAEIETWVSPTPLPDVTQEADWLRAALSRVCDSSMPRQRPGAPRRCVYWWNDEVTRVRARCLAARRRFQRYRRRRQRDQGEEDRLYAAYREETTALTATICRAKEAAHEGWIQSLNEDPWGRPYKTVRHKLAPWAPPLTATMEPQQVDSVVDALFPAAQNINPPAMGTQQQEVEESIPHISDGEFKSALDKSRSGNKAPGLDGIHGRALAVALNILGDRARAMLNGCLREGYFPDYWKTGKLVLLQKPGRPADSPSAYRPIVLLDEMGKLFERIIAARLVQHMETQGPDLSEVQFGFRRGKSTVDAIRRVVGMAEDASAQGQVVLAVSLDIANAFNTLPWPCILEALKYHQFPKYLRDIIRAYLSGRFIRFPTQNGWSVKEISRGVPQGSVLGPLLWNIGFDWALRGQLVRGVAVTCYADDTLVTARGSDFRDAAIRATAGVAHVVSRIRMLGLEVALTKSEAMFFHGPRKKPPLNANIIVSGETIGVKSSMKYLGLVLDSRLSFEEHFVQLTPRLMATAGALSGLLKNVGGPNVACRRLYATVIRSMALYGAPVWANRIKRGAKALLRRPQRLMALRIVRGYCSVSFEAACVLAGTPPWELEARVLAAVYDRVAEARARGETPMVDTIQGWRTQEREELMLEWNETLQEPSAGERTIRAIRPLLEEWISRRHGILDYHLTQVLSRHGCFGRHLHLVAGREPTPNCHHCAALEDDSHHTMSECTAWSDDRALLVAEVGPDLSLPTLVAKMVGSERAWKAAAAFASKVMRAKEEHERERERAPDAHPMRRARTRRRRLAHDRNIPP